MWWLVCHRICRLRYILACVSLGRGHSVLCLFVFFFFNDTATTEIYTLSLHDALPISARGTPRRRLMTPAPGPGPGPAPVPDRKSTRLNSSHMSISYAVFCLKKKKEFCRDYL